MQWQFAALETYLWILGVFSLQSMVLVLCPVVQQTNQSICLKEKLVKGGREEPVHPPKPDYTGSIVPLQGITFLVRSFWSPLGMCSPNTKIDGVQG